ncbi:acyl-CoA carboxylase epsilon subunit [Streptomyces sp. H10-C2]|uniref:acyl-CoA carboxylase epsilon subunit n=1 Tax=unclassified Streptomyces TaxID=2593676 RepID=UPI0024BBA8E6|nr:MULTISPECIES: acyl-CoA carboxylase epsilon subunit [unclassified Streptomyces]MDJ0347455.1 acyl-CoA carboxylase epsilon subunit [Streptomyces sp. PH10-H1]MDJ0375682.1 acyl-CoA carboxylase epsilon subunit [Streptomyces sp. H10-C2]
MVERGDIGQEELAALAVVLASLTTRAHVPAPVSEPSRAEWRQGYGYQCAGSWRAAGR